jgi:hypothetical protein
MAEIDIQKKEGPPIVPIVLGVLALVLIIAAVWYFTGNDDDGVADGPMMPADTIEQFGTAQPGAEQAPMAVQNFRNQCGDQAQFRDEMGMEHEHEADCMRQLADGLDAVVRRDVVADQPLEQRVAALRQRAEQITQDPQAMDHANRVRGAAMEAAEIIEYIARERPQVGANLQQHAQQTRQAAEQIDVGTPLLEQRDRTSAFFSRAGDALEAMARSGQQQGQPR